MLFKCHIVCCFLAILTVLMNPEFMICSGMGTSVKQEFYELLVLFINTIIWPKHSAFKDCIISQILEYNSIHVHHVALPTKEQ